MRIVFYLVSQVPPSQLPTRLNPFPVNSTQRIGKGGFKVACCFDRTRRISVPPSVDVPGGVIVNDSRVNEISTFLESELPSVTNNLNLLLIVGSSEQLRCFFLASPSIPFNSITPAGLTKFDGDEVPMVVIALLG